MRGDFVRGGAPTSIDGPMKAVDGPVLRPGGTGSWAARVDMGWIWQVGRNSRHGLANWSVWQAIAGRAGQGMAWQGTAQLRPRTALRLLSALSACLALALALALAAAVRCLVSRV